MNQLQIDFLVRLKNLALLGKENISFKYHKKYIEFIHFLYKEGLIQGFHCSEDTINVYIRYFYGRSYLSNLKIIAKPSFEHPIRFVDLSRIRSDKTVIAIRTDQGIKNLSDCKKLKIGGKVLFIYS